MSLIRQPRFRTTLRATFGSLGTQVAHTEELLECYDQFNSCGPISPPIPGYAASGCYMGLPSVASVHHTLTFMHVKKVSMAGRAARSTVPGSPPAVMNIVTAV